MTTPGEEPQKQSPNTPGSYGEVAPGVPRYGQYAPAGWEPPQDVKDAQAAASSASPLPPAAGYPGFQGGQFPGAGPGTGSGTGPGGFTGPDELIAPPRNVALAVRLIRVAGAIQSVSVLAMLAVLFVPSAKAAVLDAFQDMFASNPEVAALYADSAMMDAVLFMTFVLSIALTASYFWLAAKIRKGAYWARTTSLVLACLSLLMLGQLSPLAIVQVVLGFIAVYLLFRSPAKEFFQAHRDRKGSLRN